MYESIRSLDDLRPGDIMIARQSTAPNELFVSFGQLLLHEHFRIGELVAGHAAFVIPGGKIVEAMPSGARERDLRDTDWTTGQAYFRLPEDYEGQAMDASYMAQSMVGVPYSWLSYAYLGLYLGGFKFERLAKHINRRRDDDSLLLLPSGRTASDYLPVEAICSVLAEQAWTLAGKKVVHGTRPQVVTPGMLAQELWTRPGVIRGGAGISLWD